MKAALALALCGGCSIATLAVPRARDKCSNTPVVVDGVVATGLAGAGGTVRLNAKSSTDRSVGDWTMIAAAPFVVSAVIGYIVQSGCKPAPDE